MLPAADRIPVVLVTGFLGSGKTTFLKRIAQDHPDWSLAFLVNEIADADVDGPGLRRAGLPVSSVIGGSLFCECNAADFLSVMQGPVLDRHRERPLDAVIIETSGVADPGPVGRLLEASGLDRTYQLRQVVTVVAPARFLKLAGNLASVDAQVRTADLVVINKLDLSGSADVEATRQRIREWNTDCTILEAVRCAFPFALPDPSGRTYPREALATCEANPFSSRVVRPTGRVPRPQFEAWLAALPATIQRVKGTVPTADGWLSVDKTVDSCDLAPVPSPADASETGLVLIAPDATEADLDAWAARLPALNLQPEPTG